MQGKEMVEKQSRNNLKNLKGKGWKPGQSGNPAGRPPNKKYLSEIARELLEEVPTGELGGRNADILVVLALIRKALSGDTRAIEMLHDWTEGKVEEKIGIQGEVLITPNMRALAAREMIEAREEEAELLNAVQEQRTRQAMA